MRAPRRRSHSVALVVAVGLILVVAVGLILAGWGRGTSESVSTDPSSADGVTILALGDSTVWDHDCVDCTHSYPHLLRAALAKTTGKRIRLIDATQQNFLTAPTLLQEITADSWGSETESPNAPRPKAAIAGADIVTITLGANDAPWQRDDDFVCKGEWQTKTCIDALVKPSVDALGKVIDAIDSLRKGKPTAIRVTNFYNELIQSADQAYIPDRPQKWIEKGSTSAKAFSDVLNANICATAKSHGAVCIDIYHGINGPNGTKSLPGNWFVWPGHARGYDQTFTADAIMRAGFAPLALS